VLSSVDPKIFEIFCDSHVKHGANLLVLLRRIRTVDVVILESDMCYIKID
jgi:hypothetical protein